MRKAVFSICIIFVIILTACTDFSADEDKPSDFEKEEENKLADHSSVPASKSEKTKLMPMKSPKKKRYPCQNRNTR